MMLYQLIGGGYLLMDSHRATEEGLLEGEQHQHHHLHNHHHHVVDLLKSPLYRLLEGGHDRYQNHLK